MTVFTGLPASIKRPRTSRNSMMAEVSCRSTASNKVTACSAPSFPWTVSVRLLQVLWLDNQHGTQRTS